MKIFVTGATGVIGWELVKELANRGNEVIGYVRRIPQQLYHPGVEWVVGDLFQQEKMSLSMADCDEVYHLAALTKLHTKNSNDLFRTNVEGTTNVLEAAMQSGVSRFCFTSSCAVLEGNSDEMLTEHSINHGAFSNNYNLSKFMAEQKVLDYVREGLDARIVSVSRLFGPAQLRYANPTTRLINAYLNAPFFFWPGNGYMQRNYAYIKDVVNGHINAMRYGLAGERYNLGGYNLSYRQLIAAIDKAAGRPKPCFGVPYYACEVLVMLEGMLAGIRGKAPKMKRGDLSQLFASKPVSSQKAIAEIRYRITPLEDALATTVSFLEPSTRKSAKKESPTLL